MSLLTDARQYPLRAQVDIAFGDIPGSAAVSVLELPEGSVVTNIQLIVDTAFSGGTTHDLDIGDASDPNRYTATITEIDAAGIPANPPAVTLFETTLSEPEITVTPTHTGGDPTAGALRLLVEYVIAGRQNENQGVGLEFQGAPA